MNELLEYAIKEFGNVSMYYSETKEEINVYLGDTLLTLPELVMFDKNFEEAKITFEVSKGDNEEEYGVIDIIITLPFKILNRDVVIKTWVENNNDFQPISVFKEYEDYIKGNINNLNVTVI
jgi:hypothetical protein